MTQEYRGRIPKVAHILRPAQGGMRELVRTLLTAAQPISTPLLIAPDEVQSALDGVVPDATFRLSLRVESAAPYHQLAAGQIAGRFAKRSGAELIHGHGLRYAPMYTAASVAAGIPLVVSLHNLVPADMTGIQKTAARTALSRASMVIAVSRAVAESAADIVGDPDRLIVIPNGIDVTRFDVIDAQRQASRESVHGYLGVAAGDLLIVCLSRLSPEKDVANLIEAFSLLASRFPAARLCVAGEGRLRKTLEWQVRLLRLEGRVMLPGAFTQSQVRDLLLAADLFALSSREEGLSLAVLEAMAAGLPVAATRVGGLPEAVNEGVTGILAPARDPSAFAQALETLLSDAAKRDSMGRAGKARVGDRFTDSAMIASTFALYERVVNRR